MAPYTTTKCVLLIFIFANCYVEGIPLLEWLNSSDLRGLFFSSPTSTENILAVQTDVETKKPEQLIKESVSKHGYLKTLDSSQVKQIVSSMYPKDFLAGSTIIEEEQEGTELYVATAGEFLVEKQGSVLNRFGPGRVFGEIAVIYNIPRTASVRATKDSQVWVLDGDVLQAVLKQSRQPQDHDLETINVNNLDTPRANKNKAANLKKTRRNNKNSRTVPNIKAAILDHGFLKSLDSKQVDKMVAAMYPKSFPKGSTIIKEGDIGKELYVSASGDFHVTKGGVVLNRFGPGKVFGELALLYGSLRTASVQVLNDSEVWVLDGSVFDQILKK